MVPTTTNFTEYVGYPSADGLAEKGLTSESNILPSDPDHVLGL